MTREEFNKLVDKGQVQGKCRYDEYWFVYQNIPDSGTVLDLGVGQSALPQILMIKGLWVYACDSDKRCVEYQLDHGVTCYKTDDHRLPFTDNYLDVVVAVSSIEHFDNDIATVEEVKRVLRPEGMFIVTLPVDKEYTDNLYANDPKHPRERVYDYGDFEQIFLNGFIVEKLEFLEPAKGWDSLNGLMAVLRKI